MRMPGIGPRFWWCVRLLSTKISRFLVQGIGRDVKAITEVSGNWKARSPLRVQVAEALCTARFGCYDVNFHRSHWQSVFSLKLSGSHSSA